MAVYGISRAPLEEAKRSTVPDERSSVPAAPAFTCMTVPPAKCTSPSPPAHAGAARAETINTKTGAMASSRIHPPRATSRNRFTPDQRSRRAAAIGGDWDSCLSVTKMRAQPAAPFHGRVVPWNSYAFLDIADGHSAPLNPVGMGTLL